MARLATSSFPYKQVSHFLQIHLSMEKAISLQNWTTLPNLQKFLAIEKVFHEKDGS